MENKEKKEKKANNVHEILIEIKGKDWEEKLNETFKKIIKKVKIDGFRPGKAPRSIYEQKYGKQALVIEAVDDNMQKAYEMALEKFDKEPIMQPTVAIKKADSDGVIYVFTFTTKPEVKIKKYTNLGVKKDSIKVTDKDIKDEIEKMKKEYALPFIKPSKSIITVSPFSALPSFTFKSAYSFFIFSISSFMYLHLPRNLKLK